MQTLRNIAGKKSIIIKSYAGNEGKIVTCIRLATGEELLNNGYFLYVESPYWVIDRVLTGVGGVTDSFIKDSQMTPLQDLDEPEQKVQELYTPSPSKVLDEVK